MRIHKFSAAVAAAAVVLAGCGTPGGTPGTPAEPAGAGSTSQEQGVHNDADVEFAQGMIPHHRQAVEMAELVAGRTENPEIIDLAGRIGAAQGPEIDTMTGWLQEWGAEVPAEGDMSGMDHEGMDHGDMDQGGMAGMAGMMTPEQMGRLESSSGADFDRLFLEQMTEHHVGAVEMSRVELDTGADPEALALAQTIIDTQQAEIDEMEDLLAQV